MFSQQPLNRLVPPVLVVTEVTFVPLLLLQLAAAPEPCAAV